jgi:hypothetical protein
MVQQSLVEKVFQPEHRQVRHAHARLDNPMFVITHHLLEFEGPRLGEIEILHILDK